jgi:Tfp pilus assembly protein PilF
LARKSNTSRRASPERAAHAGQPAASPGWIAPALAALTVLVFASVRHFAFVNWDDPTYITDNARVLNGLTGANISWALTTSHAPYWHPLTWLSHMADVTMFGTLAGSHHLTSLALHAASTLLLFLLLRRMTGAWGPSAFVAAVFGVHPLHVESVAWIAERKDVLSTFFLLLTMWAYASWVERPGRTAYAAVLAGYTLALMSKPMVVTLPVLLLLLDRWPLERLTRESWKQRVIEKLPLFAMALAVSISTIVVQQRVGALPSLTGLPWQSRLWNATANYGLYLGDAIWPAGLSPFYPPFSAAGIIVAVSAIALAVISYGVFRLRERCPYLVAGWLWFLITLLPVIGLVQAGEQARADRFMYVPLVGLTMMAAWGARDVARARLPRGALAIAAGMVILAYAVTARAQVRHWSDSVTLWHRVQRVTPDYYLSYENLGQALRERNQLDAARASYENAIALVPPGAAAEAPLYNSLGLVLSYQGRTRESIAPFEHAVALDPAFSDAHNNLANSLAAEGRSDEALVHFTRALELDPRLATAHFNVAVLMLKQGKAEEAARRLEIALSIDPGFDAARQLLARVNAR